MKVDVRRRDDGLLEVRCGGVGLFRRAVSKGALLGAGQELGSLEVLGQLSRLVLPSGAGGQVVEVEPHKRMPVAFGTVLLVLDPEGAGVQVTQAQNADGDSAGLIFPSPMSGRFYLRPAPDQDPFVAVGDMLKPGRPLGLLEVMKTFNRITYGGAELPEGARVKRVLVEDGADVEEGQALFELES